MSRNTLIVRSLLFAFVNLLLTRFLGGLPDSNLLVTTVYVVFVAGVFAAFVTLFNPEVKNK